MGVFPLADEPVLEMADIQGNILAGFNKDHQAFVFLSILDDGDPQEVVAARLWARNWLAQLAPFISTAEEVHQFNQLFRQMRARRGEDPSGLVATWINIAFTVSGVRKLVSPEAAQSFRDPKFATGMCADAGFLGDPFTAAQEHLPGHPNNWLFGGSRTPVDILVIVASDEASLLRREVEKITSTFVGGGVPLKLVFVQWGQTLPPPLTGHEHFGFKDGVSQPAVRGRTSSAPDASLSPRVVDPTRDAQQQNPSRPEFARPGQTLVWPGQFVFGYARQDVNDRVKPGPPNPPDAAPEWARNGSYIVCRRLRQDVAAFDRGMADLTAQLQSAAPEFAFLTPERLGALLVGRWPSGAPLMRIPLSQQDERALGANELANNDFRFQQDSRVPILLPEFAGGEGNFPLARRDRGGLTCPFAAHIRKVNPRDVPTEKGDDADTLTRLVLRRGIPFGEPLPDRAHPENDPLNGDRGLMFLCYQTSIREQFAVLNVEWANSTTNPAGGGGHDPIIGQTNAPDSSRARTLTLRPSTSVGAVTVPVLQEWVSMTGGDYFFSPGLSALRKLFCESLP